MKNDHSDFNPSYVSPRPDILNLVSIPVTTVLDVGCSTGTLGEQLKREFGAEVSGIEKDPEMGRLAQSRLDRVIMADMEDIDLQDHFETGYFDCIIFADILEHLEDPWKALTKSVAFLQNRGIIIASIPNVRHYSTLFSLAVKGYWPYRKRGIHDRAHLRFFTLKNIREMFSEAGLEIKTIKRKYRIIERPHRYNRLSRFLAFLPCRNFLTFQYLIVAVKAPR